MLQQEFSLTSDGGRGLFSVVLLWVIARAKVRFKKTRTGPLKTGSSLQLPWNEVSFSYMSRFKSWSAGSGTPQSAVATSASLLFT